MSQIEYESFDEVFARIRNTGITSSSQIIRRAIDGTYSQHPEELPARERAEDSLENGKSKHNSLADIYIFEGGLTEVEE